MDNYKQKGKILVVDDTPATIGILSETLESDGFQVFIATSGNKAITRAENIQPDLILLDVMMPGIDGFETCTRLKAIEKIKDVPILFMTGLSAIESKVKGFQAGAVDYVTKPIEIDEVLSRIKTHLALQNTKHQLLEKNTLLEKEINERKIAEEKVRELNAHLEKRVDERTIELANVNRMLTLLSECNQALVRILNEEELLQKISKIIVDYGGYPLVQVGFFQDGSHEKVRLSCCEGRDYSESNKEIMLTQKEVRLLENAGFFDGQPFVSGILNFQTQPELIKQMQTGESLSSFIFLPLIVEGNLTGFLKIYSDQSNAFNSEEVALLTELAGDLAFGIKLLKDRTELENTEKELRQNKILFDQVTDQSQVVVWSINDKRELTFVSDTCYGVTGYTPEELMNVQNFMDLFPEEGKERVVSTGVKSRENKETVRDEIFKIFKKDGEIISVSTTAFPTFDSSGNYTGFWGSILNVTERQRMINELIEAKKAAEEANKLKDSLLSNMSHEFRTPLNGILGFAQLLEDEISDLNNLEMIRKINRSGKRLMNTLNSVLTLIEVNRKDFRINLVKVDVRSICEQVKNAYQTLAEEKQLNFIFSTTCSSYMCLSDESLLRKMLSYLVDNAIKYTHKGEVKIWIENKINESGVDTLLIHIKDTGIGIRGEDRSLIFKEFRQASEGFKRAFEGIGLGLSISKKISTLIGANISLESEVGVGTEFIITLPALSKSLSNGVAPDVQEPQMQIDPRSDLEILLIEDNLLNIEVIKRFLKKKGNITAAQEGPSAIKLASSNNYDLFLIDINLGHDIDGTEVLKHLRTIERYENTPMIAITGYASETSKTEFLKMGFSGYLPKPFEKRELISLIDEQINEYKY